MAESSKAGSKTAENTLGLIGAVADIFGKLALGPDAGSLDLGAPFKLGAQLIQNKRKEQDLVKLFADNPATKPLVDVAPHLIEAGGIANNLDLLSHPEVQGMFTGPKLSGTPDPSSLNTPIPQGMSQIAPGNNLLSTLSSMQQPQPQNNFMQRAAELAPDAVQAALPGMLKASSGQGLDDLLRNILLVRQIESFETPEQKRAAQQKIRQENMADMDRLIGGRQEENQKRAQSFLIGPQIDKLSGIDNALTSIRALPDQAPKFSRTSATIKQIPGIGGSLVSTINPEFAQVDKQLKDAISGLAFAKGGKNLTSTEKELTFGTLPSLSEDPSFYPVIKKSAESRVNLVRLSELDTLAKAGKNVSDFIDTQTLADYRVWKDLVNKTGTKYFDDPDVIALMQNIGIDGIKIKKVKK